MEPAESDSDYLTVGTDLTAVFYDDGRARAESAHVYAEAPFYITCREKVADRVFPQNTLLLWKRGDEVLMSDARATHSEQVGPRTLVEMEIDGWNACDDRRTYPRYACASSVALRPVRLDQELIVEEAIYGRTRDLSISGAFVLLADPLEIGQVVEFYAVLSPGVVVRALSVVARRHDDQNGVGVAFLEFLGDGKNDLERYLSKVA